MMDEIKPALRRFIETELAPGAEFADDESLMDSGVLSSMGITRLIEFMRERFRVELDEAEFEPDNFETIEAMAALINDKISGKPGNTSGAA